MITHFLKLYVPFYYCFMLHAFFQQSVTATYPGSDTCTALLLLHNGMRQNRIYCNPHCIAIHRDDTYPYEAFKEAIHATK